ncbi:cytochrome B561 [Echinococcus multilocularis]|uniref:Cytochrome B561 n=1 Tax=Echinococcus multilocularis TaxID=6211 RepID=A0A068YDZ1_ECHMU|nr:cytochrome B561 [Echinococcus multilocularis]
MTKTLSSFACDFAAFTAGRFFEMSEGGSAGMNLRTYDSLDRPPNEEASKRRCLIPIAAIAQIFGIAAVVMCTVWMGYYYGGFDWRNPALVFNYHPVFMVIGMIFCFGDAMLIYRVFHKCPKLPLKAVHGVLMILGLLFSVVGFKAAFDSHNMRGIPDVYSIHSWIGLVTVVLFAVQWVVGLIAFLVPYIPPRVRSKILPLHTATGLFLLCCALVAAISGITEKNFGSTYKDLPAPAMLSNFMGVCLVVFCGMVFYLVHRHDYRRLSELELITTYLRVPSSRVSCLKIPSFHLVLTFCRSIHMSYYRAIVFGYSFFLCTLQNPRC